MKLRLLDKAICRTPAFHRLSNLKDVWPQLKLLIRDASPDLYLNIEAVSFEDIENLPAKLRTTIWKYFNRAKHRCTPFGGFAAVSVIPLCKRKTSSLKLNSMVSSLILADREDQCKDASKPLKLLKNTCLQTNPTLYHINTEFRYTRTLNGEFCFAAVPTDPLTLAIIDYCKHTITVADIAASVNEKFGLEFKGLKDHLYQMIALELLFCETKTNLTGQDYNIRLKYHNDNPAKTYRIDQRAVDEGEMTWDNLADIQSFVKFSANLKRNLVPEGLDKFTKDYRHKFGDRSVRLAHVLDPEIGIGYMGLGDGFEGTVAQFLSDNAQDKPIAGHEYFLQNEKLMRFVIQGIAGKCPIRLETFKANPEQQHDLHLPNTFSAVISYAGNQAVVEHAGGCTANALLGRFTLLDGEFAKLASEVVNVEKEANPNILFFDISYANEVKVDNINRRLRIYDYELSISEWSVGSGSLQLSDIWVTLQNDEIILWSETYQKRVIPRFSSAYNYQRSNLSLFRFLCDLQTHHLKNDLSFKIMEILPGMDFYPRVYFRNIIVSLAMWLVPEEIKNYGKVPLELAIAKLRKWILEKSVTSYFKYGHNDQTLVFDVAIHTDLEIFISLICLDNRPLQYITEYDPFSQGAMDEKGQVYNQQLVINICHDEKIYETPNTVYINSQIGAEKEYDNGNFHIPGGNWVYFEIYCHPIRSDSVLITGIFPLIDNFNDDIDKWFFVRYNDPYPHLRIRIRFLDEVKAVLFLTHLQREIKIFFRNSQISDLQIKTYFPEKQRYNVVGIVKAEALFYLDSSYVRTVLCAQLSEEQKQIDTLNFMDTVLSCVCATTNEKLLLSKRIASTFAQEMHWKSSTFKKINESYRTLNAKAESSLRSIDKHLLEVIASNLNGVLQSGDQNSIETFVTDFLHMHINRIFSINQRLHEAVLYQFLTRMLQMQVFQIPEPQHLL